MKTPSLLALSGFWLALAGCTTPPMPEEQQAQQEQAMTRRIDEICALPPAERDKELERLKKESGLVLFCGKNEP